MYVVYIQKWSSVYALGGVSGVASFVQAMLPEGFPFHQFVRLQIFFMIVFSFLL